MLSLIIAVLLLALVFASSVVQSSPGTKEVPAAAVQKAPTDEPHEPRKPLIRYQVKDVDRAVEFYVERLGFRLIQRPGPPIAIVSDGLLTLWLSGPDSSGSRPMPDGRTQEPGGWNRFAIEVQDIDRRVAELRSQGVKFRNTIEAGPGGRQIQIEDPDGNPVELFEPAR
jgi:glyoxylase I family protein